MPAQHMVFVNSLGPWSLRSLLHTPRHPKWPPAATSSHPTHTSQHNNSHLHTVVVCYTETGKAYGAEVPTHPSRAKNIEIRHVCQGKCQHTSLWRNAWLHDSWFGVLNGNICQDAESHVALWKLKLYNNLWQKSSGSVWKGALAVEKVRQHKDEDSLQCFCHSCGDHAHLPSCCMLHIAMTKLVDTMVWCHPATLFFWNVQAAKYWDVSTPGPSQQTSNNTHTSIPFKTTPWSANEKRIQPRMWVCSAPVLHKFKTKINESNSKFSILRSNMHEVAQS